MTIRATIRLQFNSSFTLDDAAGIVPYLSVLGISHIYASPLFVARRGSTHGYDVVDPTAINPELGGSDALARLSAALKSRGMGLILDIVPNHMAASAENPWWMDVLEAGRASRYANFFDINWRSNDPLLRNKVLLPILGADLASCLERGEIKLDFDPERQRFICRYFEQVIPLSVQSYADILSRLGAAFQDLADEFDRITASTDRKMRLGDEIDRLRGRLTEQIRQDERDFTPLGDPDFLHLLLERQHYLLVPWQEAASRLNWRRFFDINELVALQMDRPEVFDATHQLVFALYRDDIIDGIRLDHVDGLADPRGYCRKLRRDLKRAGRHRASPGRAPYIIVEKILEPHEKLPKDWQVDGTTGYDFMSEVAAVLHDGKSGDSLSAFWSEATGQQREFAVLVRAARHEILEQFFAQQLDNLVQLFIANERGRQKAVSAASIRRALAELLSRFTRYRLYGDNTGFAAEDDRVLAAAQLQAANALAEPDRETLNWICGELRRAGRETTEGRIRFQQLSATLTAKAVEDTAFYRYGRLLSRNEVGADPGMLAITAEQFHVTCQQRLRRFPRSLLATATHDHKRGEDVRMRLAVLSERPADWRRHAARWLELHRPMHQIVPASVKLMTYQMLIGAWPFEMGPDDRDQLENFRQRLSGWLMKSIREAKQETSWTRPDAAYEEACQQFLAAILDPDQSGEFLHELAKFAGDLAVPGALNALSQVTLRLTCPGIPDLYQGTEWWDLSLVDPDNRRPVDFKQREDALSESLSQRDPWPELLINWHDGRLKQYLIGNLLRLRQHHPALFEEGGYLPLAVSGPAAEHLLAFVRHSAQGGLIVVVPRLCSELLRDGREPFVDSTRWTGTFIHLPAHITATEFHHELNGRQQETERGTLSVATALRITPVCVLRYARSSLPHASA